VILLVLAHSIDINGSEQDCGADVDWNFLPSWTGMQSLHLTFSGLGHTFYIHTFCLDLIFCHQALAMIKIFSHADNQEILTLISLYFMLHPIL